MLTGQNLTDLLSNLPADDGVLLRHDLEYDVEDAVEGVDLEYFTAFDDVDVDDDDVVEDDVVEIFGFFEAALELKSELRNVASFPPGEIGCFTFFKSP